VATLTVRNVPDDAKHRFRQVAAAHGRSMEEHLRQLVIETDFEDAGPRTTYVAEARQSFRHSGEEVVRKLIDAADGAGNDVLDPRKYAEIRYLTAKDAMAELRRLANGVGLDLPPRLSTKLEAPDF
jgi:plasmid stability protein